MCLLCRKEYNEKTTEIKCCNSVTEIPLLPNLIELDCSFTKITEIPFLPNLITLYCWNTNITEIPLLPNLTTLYCSKTKISEIPFLPNLITINCSGTNITEITILPNLTFFNCSYTKITELPKISPNCYIYYDNCIWLKQWYEESGKLNDFILLENKIKFLQKQYQKKKWNKIHKKIPLIRDIKNIILNLLWRFNANPYASERRWDL